jgi:aminoglycoside 6'-N-acetyltransferase
MDLVADPDAIAALTLRPLRSEDGDELRRIMLTDAVRRWWGSPEPGFPEHDDPEATRWTIVVAGAVAGLVQYAEELEPRYRHASVDIYLDPALHGRGLGTEVMVRLLHHLVTERGHHRVTIDPARANLAAVRSYEKAGFRRVGVLRSYEREPDGADWRDGLLMEFVSAASPAAWTRSWT